MHEKVQRVAMFFLFSLIELVRSQDLDYVANAEPGWSLCAFMILVIDVTSSNLPKALPASSLL